MGTLNMAEAQAEAWAKRGLTGVKQIFIVSIAGSLLLILAGFGCNDFSWYSVSPWLITTGAILSFVSVSIALFIYMGPAWVILLILPKTSEQTQQSFKKWVLPLITWISAVNMLFLILPTENWGIKNAVTLIFAIIVVALILIILDKQIGFTYRLVFAVAVMVIVALLVKLVWPVGVTNFVNNFIAPANKLLVLLTSTWYGWLLIITTLYFILPMVNKFIYAIIGEKTKSDEAQTTAKPKRKLPVKQIFKWAGIIVAIAVVLMVVWRIFTVYQPGYAYTVKTESEKLANEVVEVVKPVVNQVKNTASSISYSPTPPAAQQPVQPQPTSSQQMPKPQKKQGQYVFSGIELTNHNIWTIPVLEDGFVSFSEAAKYSFDGKQWETIDITEELFCKAGTTLRLQNISQNPTMEIYVRM